MSETVEHVFPPAAYRDAADAASPERSAGQPPLRAANPLIDSIHGAGGAATSITDVEQLRAWIRGPLRALIPHEKALIGFGQCTYDGLRFDRVEMIDMNGDYPAQLLDGIDPQGSPVFRKWYAERIIQRIEPALYCPILYERWHRNLEHHRITDGIMDAVVAADGGRIAFIKLFNLHDRIERAMILMTQIVTPLLPGIWQRICAGEVSARQVAADRWGRADAGQARRAALAAYRQDQKGHCENPW